MDLKVQRHFGSFFKLIKITDQKIERFVCIISNFILMDGEQNNHINIFIQVQKDMHMLSVDKRLNECQCQGKERATILSNCNFNFQVIQFTAFQ